jgi:signal transduction histidine kinase
MPPLSGVDPQRHALIALSMSLGREAGGVSTVLTFAAAASALALILGAFIAGRIVRHSLRPVNALAAASQRLAAGDLGTRVTIPPGRDEIGRLARSFNDMAVQLDSAFSAQRAFVADASHELRTPLAALRGQVDVMRRALPEQPADADRLATSMRRELARLSRLVDDLLILARIDALGSAALALQPVDVRSVAEDVCAQVGALPMAKHRDIRLVAGHPVRITADGERLHQVLLNLLANAVEHTPSGGSATLSVEPSTDGAHIVVRDTGAGIPGSALPNIFDRFYRVDTARRRIDGGGAGLGLSIVRAIVEAHGGTISAANCPEGGAKFVVDIPSQP